MASFLAWIRDLFRGLANRWRLDPEIYLSFEDVTLPAGENGTTQIDRLVVSRFGIFVIEDKNFKGWIYGRERDAEWTLVTFHQKHRFQNPLRQNYRHVKELAKFLQVPEKTLHSVVRFLGDSRCKTPMPANVLSTGYMGYIQRFKEVHFSDECVQILAEKISTGRLPRTRATEKQHLESLHVRHASTTVCAKCGKALVRRNSRYGAFYGCTGYPKCRHTKPATSEKA